jgi:[acyl-carrier-protein] S-malonyltransferase
MNLALLFPGQGSQYIGMGANFYQEFASVRLLFEQADNVLGYNLENLCFSGNIEELTKTEYTQPALLTLSVAIFNVYMEEIGIKPRYLAGHSLGEISALTCAGGIEFSDALKIVQKRGQFMQTALPEGLGTMLSISGINQAEIETECLNCSADDEIVCVSNYNSPDQIVISGHKSAVGKVGEKLSKRGAIVTFLKVSSAFHSPLMGSAARKLASELMTYKFLQLKWPVISNVDGLPYTNPDEILERLIRQIEKPVRWQESLHYLKKQGITTAIEIGPHNVLKNLVKRNTPNINTYAYDKPKDRQTVKKLFLANQGENRQAAKVVSMCLAAAMCTRNRNWNNDEYRIGVIEPYRRIKAIYDNLQNENQESALNQIQEALEMLRLILETKKAPVAEQNERFSRILQNTGIKHLFGKFVMSQNIL